MISATYSPEDNKIRIYSTARLDSETYARVKEAGFKWAPRQGLFVAPKWTPQREDIAIELAGDIEPEEMTLAERAALKVERLESLAHKRNNDANAYARRADELSERFYMGQPILIGHHSERRARKDQERMQSAQGKAVESHKAANYWLYRATGVERFANMKNDSRTRANRIKTLLAELRDLQRAINQAHKGLTLWESLDTAEKIKWAIENVEGDRLAIPYGTYGNRDSIELIPFRQQCIERLRLTIEGPVRRRWIEHTLNRLSFERSLLGDVPRFEGEFTPVILQAFAREHGAEKPQACETEPGSWQIESPVPLPLHIANGVALDMIADDWRDLMQSVGYTVPEAKPRRVSSRPAPMPLFNLSADQAAQLQRIWNLRMMASCNQYQTAQENHVKAVTQAVFSANSKSDYSVLRTIEIDSECRMVRGMWRAREWVNSAEPVARIRIYVGGAAHYKPDSVVHITDKPTKPLPIDLDAIESAALEAVSAKELEAAA